MQKLTRRFTPLSLLTLSINGMVGSAWLFAPLYAAKIAGPAAIMAWLVAGFATIVIGLTFAELSVLFPVAGGSAHIPQISHGNLTSFIVSWIAWLSALTMAPIEVQAILQYASNYFTSLMTVHTNGTSILTWFGLLWAALLMLLFCAINIYSYKGLIRFNFLVFLFKTIVIMLVCLLFMQTRFETSHFNGTLSYIFSANGWHAILSAVATAGVAFAFTGFKHGVELAGETKNVKLAVPLAIVGSVIACLILYIALQVAFIGALSTSSIEQGWSHINFSGDAGPFAGLAAGLGLFWLVKLLYIDAAVSPGGAGLIYVTSTARILYAMSEIGYVPKFLSYVNKQKFPVAAILVNFALGMFLFLPLPGWQAMVSFLVSGMVLSYAMGPIALLVLREAVPHKARPFRLMAAKIFCPLAFYFCTLLSYWTGWDTLSKLIVAIVIGLIIFAISTWRNLKMQSNLGLKSSIWLFPYLGGLALISYLGTFGGIGVISFGWDFLFIGLLSLIIFKLAVKNRLAITEDYLDNFLSTNAIEVTGQ